MNKNNYNNIIRRQKIRTQKLFILDTRETGEQGAREAPAVEGLVSGHALGQIADRFVRQLVEEGETVHVDVVELVTLLLRLGLVLALVLGEVADGSQEHGQSVGPVDGHDALGQRSTHLAVGCVTQQLRAKTHVSKSLKSQFLAMQAIREQAFAKQPNQTNNPVLNRILNKILNALTPSLRSKIQVRPLRSYRSEQEVQHLGRKRSSLL
jgi:hypothetical protein